MAQHVLVAFTNATPGHEKEFNEWYNGRHLPEVLEVPGFVSAERFVLSDAQIPGMPPAPNKYLAIYRIETDDIGKTVAALGASADRMYISEALDKDHAVGVAYTKIFGTD